MSLSPVYSSSGVIQPYSANPQEQKGQLGNYEFVPVSKGDGGKAAGGVCGSCCGSIMFVLGIILWAVGAAQGNAAMVLAGQVLFGLSVAPLACACAILCCCGPCLACLGCAALSSQASQERGVSVF